MPTRSCLKEMSEKLALLESQAMSVFLVAEASQARKDKSGFMDQEGRQEFPAKTEEEASAVKLAHLASLVLQDNRE